MTASTQRYLTVVPIVNVPEFGGSIEFGDGLVFTKTPEWILKDEWLQRLSQRDRDNLAHSPQAFVAEYEAEALGDPDPRWNRGEPKSKQDLKYELALLGNLAMWLTNPTPARLTHLFHCRGYDWGWSIQHSSTVSQLLCHPDDVDRNLRLQEIEQAAYLHTELTKLHISECFWSPALIACSALQMSSELVRYLLAWVALESLFGPEDGRELRFRLAQRIGLFLGNDGTEAKEIFAMAKKCYDLRSKVAHGTWTHAPENTQRMKQTEDLLRRGLTKVLKDPEFIRTFTGNSREAFLDGLAFH